MERRFFERDPLTGAERYFLYDHSDDSFTIEQVEDVEDLVEQNKALANEDTGSFDEFHRVASIPMSIYFELKEKGILDDQAALRRWLNDRDNRVFRTRHGRV
jgi:hypothetical protein